MNTSVARTRSTITFPDPCAVVAARLRHLGERVAAALVDTRLRVETAQGWRLAALALTEYIPANRTSYFDQGVGAGPYRWRVWFWAHRDGREAMLVAPERADDLSPDLAPRVAGVAARLLGQVEAAGAVARWLQTGEEPETVDRLLDAARSAARCAG